MSPLTFLGQWESCDPLLWQSKISQEIKVHVIKLFKSLI